MSSFIISREDWSLHRKGYQDQARHREKVREAIRANLPELIAEESLLFSDGRRLVKVPIRSLEEYRFRFNAAKAKHVGHGRGATRVGDVVAADPSGSSGRPPDADGAGAGDMPGEDYVETEVGLDEIESALFEELELPYLERKEADAAQSPDIAFRDIRKTGISANLDKKRTILSHLLRRARRGERGPGRLSNDDLRFKTWTETDRPHANAVVIAMMDTSGSMGPFEKYAARTFFFWTTRFLRTHYDRVDVAFVAHHAEAREVTEEEFFSKGESGGTVCSSAYQYALDMIDRRYSPSRYNVYTIHFSDGDNLASDNDRCVRLVGELLERSNLFGYGEINPYNRTSTLMTAFRHIRHERFRCSVIREKGEIYQALKTFFGNPKL